MLRVEDLTMHYATREGRVRAVQDVTFDVGRGEIVGIAGESGSGKSSLALTLLRLLPRYAVVERGRVLLDGEDLLAMGEDDLRRIRGAKMSYVPQASMNALDPVFTVGDQLAEAVLAHRDVGREEALRAAAELLDEVGVGRDRLGSYPHELSGGQRQRVAIAMALINSPELVILDEPTTALDVIVQAQILRLLEDLRARHNMGMILITHDLSVIAELADTVIIYYGGRVVERAPAVELYRNPLHPYTQALLKAFPDVRAKRQRFSFLPGSPPNLADPPPGCPFHPRCPYAFDRCRTEVPRLREVSPGHWVACHLVRGDADGRADLREGPEGVLPVLQGAAEQDNRHQAIREGGRRREHGHRPRRGGRARRRDRQR
ncbi:MAG: ABC transporter ATP-binding protein [Nitrososphaeria archaeon]